jgi:cell division protein FtsA
MQFGFIKDVTAKNSRIVVGLDVGSTRVCAVVGEVARGAGLPDSRGVHVIGAGYAPSRGIKKGVVINIEQTVESIREAVEKAEGATGIDIKTVAIGITGSHIEHIPSQGVIAVKEKEIGQKDVEMVIDAARAVAVPFDREILHVIPSEFMINGQGGITDPRGMAGIRLEAKVQIITASASLTQNLIKCCQKAGLEVAEVVFQPVAAAEAVLTRDEKDLGVALINIGGGTTDIACFHEGFMSHFSVLAVGGGNFTNDVAIGLRLSFQEAEQVKKEYGCAMLSLIHPGEEMEVRYGEGKPARKIPRTHLVEILQPRAEELFGLIREEITSKGIYSLLNSGVVLTGGSVRMKGIDVMAENILELPVRVGSPLGVGGPPDIVGDPAYSSGIGLALREADACMAEMNGNGIFHGIKAKMSGWFK